MITPDRPHHALLAALLALLMAPAAAGAQKSPSADLRKDYALIYGTVWNKANHPVSGVHVRIRRAGDKKLHWQLISDRSGEFAQRVPPGKADYEVCVEDTRETSDPAVARRKYRPGQLLVSVHIENNERADISLHLTE
ncbi:MAG: hypothetical protein ACR2IF_01170 [Terriglobales bacterium]